MVFALFFLSPQLIDYCSCEDNKVNYRDFLLAFPSNLFPEAEGQDQQLIVCWLEDIVLQKGFSGFHPCFILSLPLFTDPTDSILVLTFFPSWPLPALLATPKLNLTISGCWNETYRRKKKIILRTKVRFFCFLNLLVQYFRKLKLSGAWSENHSRFLSDGPFTFK